MNIGIDANYLLFEKAGVGVYTKNIINNLLKIDSKNQYCLYFSFLRHRGRRIEEIKKKLPDPLPSNVALRISRVPAKWKEILTKIPLPIERFVPDDLDIFFAPYVSGVPKKGFKNSKTKIVTTVHDLVFLRFPEHRGRKLSKYYLLRHKIAAKNSKKIIAVSKATRNDLVGLLKVPQNKIEIIYEGCDPSFRKASKNKKLTKEIVGKYVGRDQKYILSVGTLEPRKNLAKLLEAYSLLPHRLKKEYRLVLAGNSGWNNSNIFKTLESLNLKECVTFLGFVSAADLPYIYNSASVFVYPSLYEGFGLPVLEAMAAQVPVVCSKNSSLVEVAGPAAVLIDPLNENSLSLEIKKILLNSKLADKMKKSGTLQAKKFSWEKTARQTLEVFKKVAKEI